MSEQSTYNYKVVRQFAIMTVVWGIVGMLVGVIIAAQLIWPDLNFGPWLTYGRLRPLHTNAVIFAFVGNMMFAGVYYSTQRLVKARLASDFLSQLHFWGWQAIIVAAAVTLPLGLTRGKEYAELIWPSSNTHSCVRATGRCCLTRRAMCDTWSRPIGSCLIAPAKASPQHPSAGPDLKWVHAQPLCLSDPRPVPATHPDRPGL